MPKVYFAIHHIKYNGETTLLNNPLKVEVSHDLDLLQSLKHCLFTHRILPDVDLKSVTFSKNGHYLMNDDMPSNGTTYDCELKDEKEVCKDCLVVLNIEDPLSHCYVYHRLNLPRNSTYQDLLHGLMAQKILKSAKHVSIFQNDNEKVFNLNEKCKDRGFYVVSSRNTSNVLFNVILEKSQRFTLLYDAPSSSCTIGQALDNLMDKYFPNLGVYNVEKLVKRKNNNQTPCSVVDKVGHGDVYDVSVTKAKISCQCIVYLNDRYYNDTHVTLSQNTSLARLSDHIHIERNVTVSKIQYYSEIFDEFIDYFPQIDDIYVHNDGKYCIYFIGTVESLHDVS